MLNKAALENSPSLLRRPREETTTRFGRQFRLAPTKKLDQKGPKKSGNRQKGRRSFHPATIVGPATSLFWFATPKSPPDSDGTLTCAPPSSGGTPSHFKSSSMVHKCVAREWAGSISHLNSIEFNPDHIILLVYGQWNSIEFNFDFD